MASIMRSNVETDDGLEQVIVMARVVDPVDRKGGMRLNNEMKLQVVDKALKHAFGKRADALLKEEQALTRAFWLDRFGPAKLKHARALGEPFVVENKDVYNNKQPDGVHVHWHVGGHTLNMRTELPLPVRINGDRKYFSIKDEKLVARCREWQDAAEVFHKERSKVETTLGAMLSKITTFKSLETTWPEGKPFYQHLPKAFPFQHQVPAVQIAELNAALGV